MFKIKTFKSIAKAVLTGKSPYYIQFYIIGKCNLKCRQCNIVETNSRLIDMSLDQIKDMAKNIADIGGGIVLLTGGEPFMHPQLPEIVNAFTSQGLNVRCQTAGTKYATNERLRAVYDAGARDINVSLDSLDLNTSDYINAVPGSGENAIDAMERISNIFRNDSAILSFGTVLSQFNYREIPSILDFAEKIGWFVSLVPVHISSYDSPKGFRSFNEQFCFTKDQYQQLDQLGKELVELKKAGKPLFDSERFLMSSIDFLKGQPPTWRKNNVCDSPDLYFAVRPNGDFTTCCDYTLKNPPKVYEREFVSQYRSGQIRNRKDVKKIVGTCAGCHYGSYPEVSLSVNDFSTFIERSLVTLKSGKNRLKNAEVKTNFLELAKRIQEKNPQVYPVSQWLRNDLVENVSKWSTMQGRTELIKLDNEERKKLNRVRGQGEEPDFTK
jgi:MoaA/NifB/PqqE/SkfB family radical SAM enzyme